MNQGLLRFLGPGLVLLSLGSGFSPIVSKDSLFKERLFRGQEAQYPVSRLRETLAGLPTLVPLPDPRQEPHLVHIMLPQGRSLQSANTDFAHPRVLFGFIPSPYSDGTRFFYKDVVDRLFVSYSELQNALEIISWNNYEGRFNFEAVHNYVPAPGTRQQLIEERHEIANHFTRRQLCMSCHQAGGPIYSEKPWSESSSGVAHNPLGKSPIVAAIEKAVGGPDYLGLKIDPGASTAAGEFHVVVKDAHSSLLNARRIAKRACAAKLECRQAYLGAVIELASQSGYYENPEDGIFAALPFHEGLKHLIDTGSWPSHQFAFPDPTLPDRGPSETPTLEQSPATQRATVQPIPISGRPEALDLAVFQMLLRGYEGFGFLYSDLPRFKACSSSAIAALLASREFGEIVRAWNLNDQDSPIEDFDPLYHQILKLLEGHCAAASAAPSRSPASSVASCLECHATTGPAIIGQNREYLKKQLWDYREGLRTATPMNAIAGTLSDEQLEEFSAELSSRPWIEQLPRDPASAELISRGERLAKQVGCKLCHGEALSGFKHTPRIAGLRRDYVKKQLQEFRSASRANDSGLMHSFSQFLGDNDAEAIAAFVEAKR